MRIRLAEPKDDAFVGEMLIESFLSQYAKKLPEVVYDEARKSDLRDMAKKRAEGWTILVAEEGDDILGTVAILKPGLATSEAWLPNAADLRQLAVAQKHFGKGYAQPLLDEAERIAWQDWHVDAICLHVRRGAAGVERLYEKRGFVRTPEGDRALPTVFLQAFVKRLLSTKMS